jgi:hypothetical protein
MPEIKDVYFNDPNYNNISYVSEWINVSNAKSLSCSVFCSQNCDIVIDYAFDGDYEIVHSLNNSLLSGNDITINVNVSYRYFRLSVLNIASNPCDLKCQAFFNNSPQGFQNIGSGSNIYNEASGNLRSIISSDNSITIQQLADEINLQSNGSNISLASAGGTSLVSDGVGPALGIKGLSAGSGIILTNNANNIEITNGVSYNTAYGEISMNTNITTPYVLNLTNTPTLLAPGSVAGNMFVFQRLSDGVLRYTDIVDRYIFVEFDMDINPTDLTYYFTFELRKNGTVILDTRNTYLLNSYEHISLQALVNLTQNDTISIYCYHNNVGGPAINTNILYYNLVCTHQQFATELYHTTGQWAFNLASNTANPFRFGFTSPPGTATNPIVHPNFTIISQYNLQTNASLTATLNLTGRNQFVSTTLWWFYVYINGILFQISPGFTRPEFANWTTTLNLIAGDFISIETWANSGTNFMVSPGITMTIIT